MAISRHVPEMCLFRPRKVDLLFSVETMKDPMCYAFYLQYKQVRAVFLVTFK